MTKNNATWLFIEPHRHYHHSECFWTSFVAMHLLMDSSQERPIAIPAFQYFQDSSRWEFIPDGFMEIPRGLDFRSLVVDGKMRTGCLPMLKVEMPPHLGDLRPDILFHTDQRVVVIEVKTVGHTLGTKQVRHYKDLFEILRHAGYHPELYFLLSAGHECASDLLQLQNEAKSGMEFKLLLWEKLLEQLCQERSPLANCLGDVEQYYCRHDEYMRGKV